MKPDCELIADHDALARLCRACAELDTIALDTEFERTRTYYPRPALVQLCDGRRTFLIDPLAIDDFAPLAGLLERASVTKIMHACEGDNEIFDLLTGVVPAPIFDTQVAAAFAGHGYSASYRELLQTLLGVELAKAETRSNWLARPLSPSQLEYAVLDVIYLPELHARLGARLDALGRRRWLEDEVRRLQAQRMADRSPERAWRKIRSARSLAPPARARLEALAAWREREARRRDLPRRMVLADDAVTGLAVQAPRTTAELSRVRALSTRAARRYGEELVGVVRGTRDEAGERPERAADGAADPRLLALLKQAVARRADELDMPAALLAQNRVLEGLAARHAAGERGLPEELAGWRAEAVGPALLAVLAEAPVTSTGG